MCRHITRVEAAVHVEKPGPRRHDLYPLSSDVDFGVIGKGLLETGLGFTTAVRAAHYSEGGMSIHCLGAGK